MGERGIVPPVKSPEERGHPAAAWIVEARTRLDLSDVAVAADLGYKDSTIRQAEAHSDNLSRPLWRKLRDYYQQKAVEQGITLPPAPAFREPGTGQSAPLATSPDIAALVGAIEKLVTVTEHQTALLAQLWPAVTGLAGEIRQDRESSFERDAALVRAILVGVRQQSAEPESDERSESAAPQQGRR